MTHFVRDNETGNQDFTLSDENGAFNGTGSTITLELTDRAGGKVNMSGKVAWISESAGTVRVQPSEGDLQVQRSPYRAAFIVTVSGKTYSFPSTDADTWKVWK